MLLLEFCLQNVEFSRALGLKQLVQITTRSDPRAVIQVLSPTSVNLICVQIPCRRFRVAALPLPIPLRERGQKVSLNEHLLLIPPKYLCVSGVGVRPALPLGCARLFPFALL